MELNFIINLIISPFQKILLLSGAAKCETEGVSHGVFSCKVDFSKGLGIDT